MKVKLMLLSVLLASLAVADEMFPKEGWKEAPNPFASPDAVVGGELVISSGPYTKSFNYYLDQTVTSAELFGAMYESLLSQHPLTLEFEPVLAHKWSISDDKKTFTFWMDPEARWSDGKPITVEDVKWTYETVLDPKNLTGPHKIGLERFNAPEIVDEHSIRFTAKEVHWENLMTLAGLQILPKHIFGKLDFNKINFEFPVVSGLYKLGELKEGYYVVLERRDDWWAKDRPRAKGVGNFKRLKYRFFMEDDNAFEAFKKGEIDYYPVYAAHRWATQTSGEKFDKNWIVKQAIYNYNPIGFQGFAINMRRAPFDDVRIRQALAFLLNREKMNRTLMYDAYFLQRSYFEDLYTKDNPCKNTMYPYDKEKARKLLAEAGWTANPKTGLLEKDGKPFVIRFLARSATEDKFLAIYEEDLKDVGIKIEIIKKDWAAWSKDMDTYNFDMTWASWSAGLFKNPESMWLSTEAERPSGQNITGYKNPKVDELIIKQRTIFDVNERHEIVREIDQLISEQVPYILLWNLNYRRLLYWNKFGMPATVLGKYGDERAAYWLWWYDEDAAADLEQAMTDGAALPKKPAKVTFDEVFKGSK
jgi:microcin C transport system substrate-binding protein